MTLADEKKGITVKIDADLHAEVRQYIEQHGMTMAEFITLAVDNELHPKHQNKEEKNMGNMRTMAFQVPEELFQRIKGYGYDRVNWVLANTVQQNHSDDRYSADNKRWARTFRIPFDGYNKTFAVKSHPGLVDLMIGQARKAWQDLGLLDYSHCESESTGKLDYTRRVLVIDPRIFDDKYKTPEDQLFFATHGNGCRPQASGRKIYGFFLKDGEQTIYSRSEVIGILKDEHLPDWARDKIAERYPPDEGETESEGITMGGM